jgi:hypothetical protein
MRFASQRDLARAVERGVRMAGLPVAYSAGFSPHLRISYVGGTPTGTASEAEYLELALTGPCAAAEVRDRLDAALPSGIDVMEVFELTSSLPVGLASAEGKHDGPGRAPAAPGTGAPPAGRLDALRLEASEWEVVVPGVTPADAASAVEVFLAAPAAEVERLTSKGMRRMDARAAVVTLDVDRHGAEGQDAACATLRMVVRHLTPAVRPDDILTALRQLAGLAPSSPPRVTRLAQGPLGVKADAARTPTAQENEKTTRREAGPAGQAGTAPASAYDQLLRGAEGPETDLRAREPDGRLPGCSRSSHKIEAQTTTAPQPPASPVR